MRGAPQAHGIELHEHQIPNGLLVEIRLLAHREGNVVEDRKVGEERTELEEHAHAAADAVEALLVRGIERFARHLDPAALRRQQAAASSCPCPTPP